MKIGTLTFHKSINYGSVLQAWALQYALRQMGYESEIIDYEPDAYRQLYWLMKAPKTLLDVKLDIVRLPLLAALVKQARLFRKFREKHLTVSAVEYQSKSNFDNMRGIYDEIIVGSDQVWNLRAYDCDDVFFLPFDFGGRKIAYAVSVNNTDFSEARANDTLRSNLMNFSAISAREESGAEKIRAFLSGKKDVDTVLDPTLLLDKASYEGICSERIIKQPYIFLYNVWSHNDAITAAKKLSEKTGLPVVTALMTRSAGAVRALRKMNIHVETRHSAPGDFISLIKYADFVVTDSFHGTAFALIMEKQFFSINECTSNGNLKNDERIMYILSSLNLMDRYVAQSCVLDHINEHIPYSEVTKKRMILSERSKQWLKQAVLGSKE